jgi:hypothetical protein
MIMGYLALGIFGAIFASVWAFLAGFGIMAVFGFYLLGGTLTMMMAIAAAMCCAAAQQHGMMTAKA